MKQHTLTKLASLADKLDAIKEYKQADTITTILKTLVAQWSHGEPYQKDFNKKYQEDISYLNSTSLPPTTNIDSNSNLSNFSELSRPYIEYRDYLLRRRLPLEQANQMTILHAQRSGQSQDFIEALKRLMSPGDLNHSM